MAATAVRVEVTIPGQPQPKQRPRSASRNGRLQVYTAAETDAAENAIRWELRARRVHPTPQDVVVELHFYVRQKRGDRKQPDIDNLEKLVLDACNNFAWYDDSQVVEKHAYLHRGDRSPRTVLVIKELT